MANTNFVDSQTPVVASWLNDVNESVYTILGNGTTAPQTAAEARTNLGLGTIATQDADDVGITGGTLDGVTLTGTINIEVDDVTINNTLNVGTSVTPFGGVTTYSKDGVAVVGTYPFVDLNNTTNATDKKHIRFVNNDLGQLNIQKVNDAYTSYDNLMSVDSDANCYINSGYGSAALTFGCRAWVNFNGVGTIAIRDSGNVSSITDEDVGVYTINFLQELVDSNYAVSGFASNNTDDDNEAFVVSTQASFQYNTLGFSIQLAEVITSSVARQDSPTVCLSVFR